MRCSLIRECLSAMADDEAVPVATSAIEAHLGGCVPCSEFEAGLAPLARAVLGAAEPVPDLTTAVLRAREQPDVRYGMWRLGLLTVALLQIGVALADLAALGAGAGHADRDLVAFDIALAVGFVVAARRPGTARGLAPLVGSLTVLLAVTSAYDVARGLASAGAELAHLVVLVGFVLTWLLRPRSPRPLGSDLHLVA